MMVERTKRLNIKRLFSVTLLATTLVFPSFTAQAGFVSKVYSEASYAEDINTAEWHNADGDIFVEDGVILFPKDSTAYTKLVSKHMVESSSQIDNVFEADFQLEFKNLPVGEEFVFAMGLQSIGAGLGEAGNVELAFSNIDGVTYTSLCAYNEDGEKAELLKPVSVSRNKISVKVKLFSNQKMEVSVGGKRVYDGTLPVSADGNFGFLQTGSCEVRLSKMNLGVYGYETPEAPSFIEDFETGFFNLNVLGCGLLKGGGYGDASIRIDEYDGTKALMFENVGQAYLATKYAYSNFELTFDILYCQDEPIFDEEGVVVAPVTQPCGLAYGSDGAIPSVDGYVTAANLFVINPDAGTYYLKEAENEADGKFVSKDGTFSVRLTVIDGRVSLSFKELDGKSYTEVIAYSHDTTPNGNIIFWAPTSLNTTWTIDNFKVTNKDVGGKDFDVEYESSEIKKPEDFAYEPLGYEYNPDKVVHQDASSSPKVSYPAIISVAVVCILSVILTWIIRMKITRNKGGMENGKKTLD